MFDGERIIAVVTERNSCTLVTQLGRIIRIVEQQQTVFA